MSREISEDGYRGADEIITAMASKGHDYSAHRDQIALELLEEGVWEGNWDVTTEFEDGLPGLRLIQEDEYDQHMDDDPDAPGHNEILAETRGGYLFLA